MKLNGSAWIYTELVTLVFALSIFFITYHIERHESIILLSTYSLGFLSYLFLANRSSKFSIRKIIIIGFFLRLITLFAVPSLSDDVFRFIWDGQLWLKGIDAYAFLPSEIRENLNNQELYLKLNSAHYYSIYPPLNQLLFTLIALFKNDFYSIISLRILIILSELISFIVLKKLLVKLNQDPKRISWYVLNPLVIIELTGNLHFEAFVILFCILCLFFYQSNKIKRSALMLGFAAAMKLTPIILLTAFINRLSIKRLLQFGSISIGLVLTGFLFFDYESSFKAIFTSSRLYFQNFEFNASIYILIRELGYFLTGYNVIQTAGPILGLATFLSILVFVYFHRKNKSIVEKWMWILLIYYAFATIIHPWYITPLIVFGIISNYKWPIAFSFLIFLSYVGYTQSSYTEILWINLLEYISLLVFIVLEIRKKAITKELSP